MKRAEAGQESCLGSGVSCSPSHRACLRDPYSPEGPGDHHKGQLADLYMTPDPSMNNVQVQKQGLEGKMGTQATDEQFLVAID